MSVILSGVDGRLDAILEPTYGQLIFQEQVTEIVQTLAGYDAGKADLIRKTIGRKIKAELDALIPDLLNAFVNYGKIPKAKAELIAESIQACSGYLFNKAHSVEYGLIAYQTAYLKANYPVEYMCSLLNANIGNTEKAVVYINECKNMGIKILPPSVKNRNLLFMPVGNDICVGLSFIKGISNIEISVDDSIGSAKEFFGANIGLRKNVRENLVKSGAMDCFGQSRGEMLSLALDIDNEIDLTVKNKFKNIDKLNNKIEEWKCSKKGTKKEALLSKSVENYKEKISKLEQKIKELIKLKLSTDSYDEVKGELETLGFTFKDKFAPYDTRGMKIYNPNVNINQFVLCDVVGFKQIKDKNGNSMAFVKVITIKGQSIELVMFSSYFQKLDEGKIYVMKIKNKNHLIDVATPKRK